MMKVKPLSSYCRWNDHIVAIIDENGVQQFDKVFRTYLCQNSTKNRAELEDVMFSALSNQGAIIYTVLETTYNRV